MACRHTQQWDKPNCITSLCPALARMALAAQTQLCAPAQPSWAPQTFCCPKTVSCGHPQGWCCSSGLSVTGERIFNWNLLKVECVFLSWRSVGIHSLHWSQHLPQKSWHISKSTQPLRLCVISLAESIACCAPSPLGAHRKPCPVSSLSTGGPWICALKATGVQYKQLLQPSQSQASWALQLSFLFLRKKPLRAYLHLFSYHSTSCHGNHTPGSNWRVAMGESTYYVLNWVSIDGDHTNGGCPLVVLLVNVFVQHWVVTKPR